LIHERIRWPIDEPGAWHLRTGATIGTTLSDRAAVSSEGIKTDAGAESGLNMIAARLSPGALAS
jgi:hypothetical protein